MADDETKQKFAYINTDNLAENDTLRNLDEPVCVFFGYLNQHTFRPDLKYSNQELRSLRNDNVDDIVRMLRREHFKAASFNSRKARNPKYIVVTETGIQTPFYDKNEAAQIAKKIGRALRQSGIAVPMSYYWGVRPRQLPPIPQGTFRSALSSKLQHPDSQEYDEIISRRGKNFFSEMLNEAYQHPNVNLEELLKPQNPFASETPKVFNGRPFVLEPEYIFPFKNLESRSVVYGTMNFKDAMNYALRPWLKKKTDISCPHRFGFVNIYKSTEDPQIYKNGDMELGKNTVADAGKDYGNTELALVPGSKNQRLATLICFDDRCFRIPENDPRWNDFKDLAKVAYIDERPHMRQRRENIIKQLRINQNQPLCYNEQGKIISESISEENREHLARIRKKLAQKIDSAVGTDLQNVSIPHPLKKQETNLSSLLFKTRQALLRR